MPGTAAVCCRALLQYVVVYCGVLQPYMQSVAAIYSRIEDRMMY